MSAAPASRLVSSPFILKGLGFDHHLHGHALQDLLKSCLVIFGSKENRWSGPIPCFPGTTRTRTLGGLHALPIGATLAAAASPSEISSFRPCLCLVPPYPLTTAYTLFRGTRQALPRRRGPVVLLEWTQAPVISDAPNISLFSWYLSPLVLWRGQRPHPRTVRPLSSGSEHVIC